MKKKQLFALLMVGVLAVLSPSAVYAAEFSDSAAEQEIMGAENPPQNDVQTSDENITEPDELFQSAPEEETETFTSGEELTDTEDISQKDMSSEFENNGCPEGVSFHYMEDKDSLCIDEIYNPGGNTIVIPAEIDGKKVTEIGQYIYYPTFEDQDEFTILTGDLVLPEGLLVIQSQAFAGAGFMSLYIPDSVKEMGDRVFYGGSVRWLHFPAGMSVFPAGLFVNCSRLETLEIPEGVTELASGALKECPALKDLYLPASMTKIGEDLFAEDAKVTIYGPEGSYAQTYAREHNLAFSTEKETETVPDQKTVLKDGVYYTYQKSSDSYVAADYTGVILEEITIPEMINGKPVSGIGEKAFSHCYRLRRVTLPPTITSIDDRGFSQCLSLEEINLPDGLENIGDSAFAECKLKDVFIPDNVKNFGTSIFWGCRNLREVRLPESMTSIPDDMFYFASIDTPITLPSGIKSIGSYAFGESSCVISSLPSSLVSIGESAFVHSSIKSIIIPDSVTKIGKGVFENCYYLQSVNWGKGLKTIPELTFKSCISLEEMRLPNTVTEIGKRAYYLSNIRRLSIPDSVKKIDKTAFTDCDYLRLFVKKGSYGETYAKNNKLPYDNGDITNAVAEQDGIRYEYRSESKTYALLKADKNIEGDIVIPRTINEKKVTDIEDDSFLQCEKVRSVVLPDTVKTIGEKAFQMCTNLEQINFPSSLTSIGYDAFSSCRLKSVFIPDSVKSIEGGAFSSCKQLEQVRFPKNLTEIEDRTFANCKSLTQIKFPDKLKKIGRGAFSDCGIAYAEFPDTLTYIDDEAFWQCSFLETIKLPKNLTNVGSLAFYSCELLKEAVIPASLKQLGNAFYNCRGLEKIEIQTGVEKITRAAFYGCHNLKEIHIPESVYYIDPSNNELPDSCVIYGKSGSSAEEFANSGGYPFVSTGTSVLGTPVLSRKLVNGNCIEVTMNKRCYNAQFYDYVLTKDSKFPTSGKYLFRQNSSVELEQEFNVLDKGTYYVFARSGRILKNGKKEYSAWSKAVKTIVALQAPKPPTIKSVTVKGKTVTVVLNKAVGAAGYTGVLAYGSYKEGCQKLLVPDAVKYTANGTATKLVFKNVENARYKLLVRGYAKQKNGTKVMGKWRARAAKIQVK
ncbi:MAG: leucine-rich repeat domain-containing protein [Eubacteriales bacterium]|nr:leucine-rich repeat domain-containing protein [Eubacteriales bacterium]